MTPPVQGPHEGLNAAVAAELRAELARKRRSTQWLADESGVAYGSLRRYLAPSRHIDVSVLAALCGALGVDPYELVAAAQTRAQDGSVSDPNDGLAAVADTGPIEGAGENSI